LLAAEAPEINDAAAPPRARHGKPVGEPGRVAAERACFENSPALERFAGLRLDRHRAGVGDVRASALPSIR
jgi:hypothetical protein